ncbi:hypothetical protein GCM10010106_04790 [Thermopolyspora flexuosa]|uniref:Putative membrane protein n=1 Tax=Thermopolyspora flexuosa TaxID=103836 RepID=A0A543IYY7_9ACTN|nr:DoxX family membrane protein [Thermopolyspora flexuosa]TQM75761.1 putative membrane protein [Thermopolyspora flexuosa]GGM61824.1 hypothetical protein GCM10010106_04790 [Thermopolyspora flexuosa]
MAPLIALVAGTVIARLLGIAGIDALDGMRPALRAGLAVMFTVTGVVHFLPGWRDDLAAMIPPALARPGLPGPHLLVTVTGVLELGGAVALLVPAAAPYAAAGLALLMAAMFPANVSAARRGVPLRGRPPTPLPLRTVLQAVFIGAAVAAAL